MAKKKAVGADHAPIKDFPNVAASVMAPRGQDEQGRWYWRIRSRDPARATLWAGWGTRADVLGECSRLQRSGQTDSPVRVSVEVESGKLRHLFDKWIEYKDLQRAAGKLSGTSVKTYRNQAAWWTDAIGDVRADRLTRATVEDTLLLFMAAGPDDDAAAARSVLNLLGVLRQALKWGYERGTCARPDLRGLDPEITDENRVNNYITHDREEMSQVLPHLGWAGPDLGVRLCAVTGCRIGEAIAVRAEDWNPKKRELRVHGRRDELDRTGKGGARMVPVFDHRLAALLDEAATRGGRLIEIGNEDPDGAVRRALALACRKAGVAEVTPHGIRRYAATQLALRGVSPVLACKILGHSLKYYLQTYCRPTSEDLRAALVQGLDDGKVIELAGHNIRAQG
jgi:integrase